MAIQKEVWTKDIEEKLFANNEFIMSSVSHDAFVDNKTVHVPQAGSLPSVSVNRSSFPATISQRTDTDLTYDLINFTSDPILIRDLDALQVNYDKRMSVTSQQINKMNDRLGLEFLYRAAQATASVTTTGTAAASLNSPGATGNRNGLILADMASAASKLDGDDVPSQGRHMVIPYNVYWNFVNAEKASLLNLDYQGGLTEADIQSGVVAKIYGFKIYVRSYTVVYDSAGAKKAIGAATATTDDWGIVGWQEDAVARAKGDIKVFIDEDKPEYYGSVYSNEINFAAKALRSDLKGIVTIQQA